MMYKLCKSEHSALRQREMEQQLLKMMGTVRYEDITVSDLCTQAGFSRKAFYRYFSGKDGALRALLDHTLLEYPLPVGPASEQAIYSSMETYFRFWKSQKPLLDALARSGLTSELIQRSLILTMTDGSISVRRSPADDLLTHEHVIVFTLSGLLSLVIQWHRNGFQESISRMAASAHRLLRQPLFALHSNAPLT
jgi:AcrR family transcriptional regulator